MPQIVSQHCIVTPPVTSDNCWVTTDDLPSLPRLIWKAPACYNKYSKIQTYCAAQKRELVTQRQSGQFTVYLPSQSDHNRSVASPAASCNEITPQSQCAAHMFRCFIVSRVFVCFWCLYKKGLIKPMYGSIEFSCDNPLKVVGCWFFHLNLSVTHISAMWIDGSKQSSANLPLFMEGTRSQAIKPGTRTTEKQTHISGFWP